MRRAVITGLGAVTPVGNDVPTTWANLVAGVSGVDVISRFDADEFPVNIAAEVKGFDATATMPVKEVRKTGLDVQYGVAAAIEAARDAEYEVTEPSRAGVIIGSAVGGLPQILEQQKVLETRGRERVSPHWLPNMLVDSTTSHVATQLGMRGVNYAIVSACASGSHAIGDAALVIRRGQADAVLAGGTESAIVPLILAGFCSMRALADGREDPTAASRPFDATRSGFVMAEGAAVVMVEDMEHALRRGARIYCEVIGYGASNDAYHVATPHPESVGVIEMMRAALGSAGISPHDIDYINAHGTSTPYNDAAETLAIKTVFGDHASQLAVSSIKSMIGHLFGAAGAIEALATALTIHHGVIPPTINYRHPDPECDLDYVPNVARQADVKVALSNSMGLGGHNGC
ncbi:MAG: 3-oxoacyl-[acyl-carrier-protein] synthase, partial [Gaiellales bacterium]|nr:3-oxoacyl-[acyl-carrier-protein] synthase [Gaiellales bacterium]